MMFGRGVKVSILVASIASAAAVEASVEAGSVLMFPYVVADGQRDTRIQLANRSPLRVFLHCAYLPSVESSSRQVQRFVLQLEPLQTTNWSAQRGRDLDLRDPVCWADNLSLQFMERRCEDAGFDPGQIEPVDLPFTGALLCQQTDVSGAAFAGNAVFGSARISDPDEATSATYDAVALRGQAESTTAPLLCIADVGDSACSPQAAYDPCPGRWRAVHPVDSEAGEDAYGVVSEFAVLPCGFNVEAPEDDPVELTIRGTTGDAATGQGAMTIAGPSMVRLADVADEFRGVAGEFIQTRIDSAPGSGFVAVMVTTRSNREGRRVSHDVNSAFPEIDGPEIDGTERQVLRFREEE